MGWKQDKIDRYNEEHLVEDARAAALISVAQDEVDAQAFNVRIPYEDLNYLHCTTVDSLLLLASGMRAKDAALIIAKRYGIEYNEGQVYKAKSRYPKEFHQMLAFYREIFLNQQCQALEQQVLCKVSDALPNIDVESIGDAHKAVQMLKMMTEIRKTKEDDGSYKGITPDAMKQLEGKMKALTGK